MSLQDSDVKFAGGLTLKTAQGSVSYDLIVAGYKLQRFDRKWAVFQDMHDRFHIREWKTGFIFFADYIDVNPVILCCEDEDVAEFSLSDLHLDVWTAPNGFFERLAAEGFYRDPRTVHWE